MMLVLSFPKLNNSIDNLASAFDILCTRDGFYIHIFYKIFRYNIVTRRHPHGILRGGWAIYIRNTVPFCNLKLGFLYHQAIGKQVIVSSIPNITIFIYPHERELILRDLQNFLVIISTPIIISGDFDRHHTFVGSNHNDRKDLFLMDCIDAINLCLLNDGSGTSVWEFILPWSYFSISFPSHTLSMVG